MSINATQLKTALGKAIVGSRHEVRKWPQRSSELSKYATTVTKVNGKFPTMKGFLDHVIQEFSTVWTALGNTYFEGRFLETFRQKVNYGFIPQDVYDSYISYLASENMTPEQKPISLWILEGLREKVADDVAILEGTGTYQAGTGAFGDSMDGIVTILNDLLTTGNPFKIPLAPLTDENIVDQMTLYERMIPRKFLSKIEHFSMSAFNKERYELRYEDQFGQKVTYKDGDTMVSRLKKKPIVGFECMDGSDFIWCTPKNNFLELKDINSPGEINDIQVLDYEVKVFMEFALAYNFWMDEMVFISDTGGSTKGLATNHAILYPEISTTPIT